MNYYDIDGRPVSLEALCRKEPEWAASRLRVYEALVEALRGAPDGCGAYCLAGVDCKETPDAPNRCPIHLAAHSDDG